jgi:hypothetical protein
MSERAEGVKDAVPDGSTSGDRWVHAVLDVPAEQHAAAADFWSRALGWPVGPAWAGHPELRSFVPPTGTPYLHLQQVDGPARVHLDVECEVPEETRVRAVGRGAVVVAEQDHWSTLRSPGGLPFCLLPEGEHEPPEPVTHPEGHRTRMVQVCVDSPSPLEAAEVDFWQGLLARRWVPSPAAEFAGKWHDDAGSPVQLLFQRLEETEGPVRAHLDLGTDDLPAEVRRLVALGAEDVGPGRGWHVLRDVTELAFCVTENSPEWHRHRDLG